LGIKTDGDENNVYIPQTAETVAELKYLMSTEECIKSSQSSRLLLCLVQDALIGGYILTQSAGKNNTWYHLSKSTFNDALCIYDLDIIINKFEHIEMNFNLNKQTRTSLIPNLTYDAFEYSGHHLLSFLFPNDFYFNNGSILIAHGIFIKGTLNKSNLGDSYSSIVHKLEKDYNGRIAVDFVSEYQFLINKVLIDEGFSVGIDDCLPIQSEQIAQKISSNFITASNCLEESHITNQLNSATSTIQKIIQDNIPKNNGYRVLIDSGAKGNYVNATQIMAMLGQQNINGTRALPEYDGRTLPYYDFEEDELDKHFESQGFIQNSYIHGLTPGEMWHHLASTRVGVTDSALKTANSGYAMRKLSKALENIKSTYIPGLCMDNEKNVLSFNYGGMIAPECTVKDNDRIDFIDMTSLLKQLNIED
jgi:DNA-directed RNA polymerase beta' subunit